MIESKRPFFFDPEPQAQPDVDTEGSRFFFNTLKDAGIIQEADAAPIPIEMDGAMQTVQTQLVSVEYGRFKGDYSIHIVPIHEKKNLATKIQVETAIVEVIQMIVPAIAPSFKVDIYLPRDDWEMKVISIVIRKAAEAWNFDQVEFEKTVIPLVVERVEKVIQNG